jgi:hypothetical protein
MSVGTGISAALELKLVAQRQGRRGVDEASTCSFNRTSSLPLEAS